MLQASASGAVGSAAASTAAMQQQQQQLAAHHHHQQQLQQHHHQQLMHAAAAAAAAGFHSVSSPHAHQQQPPPQPSQLHHAASSYPSYSTFPYAAHSGLAASAASPYLPSSASLTSPQPPAGAQHSFMSSYSFPAAAYSTLHAPAAAAAAPHPHSASQAGYTAYLPPGHPAAFQSPYADRRAHLLQHDSLPVFATNAAFAASASGSPAATTASAASSSTASASSSPPSQSTPSSSLHEQVTALTKEIERLRQDMLTERDKQQAMQRQHRAFLSRVNSLMQQGAGEEERKAWGKTMWEVKRLIDEEVTEWLLPGRVLINGSREQQRAERGSGGAAGGAEAGTGSSDVDDSGFTAAAAADGDDDEAKLVAGGLHGLHSVKYRQRTVENCRPGRLIVSQSRRPIAILHVEVQKQFTVSKRETTWMRQEERERLVKVPVRIMGATRRDHLYFVARDVCLLIHTRKGNVAKSVGQFDDTEKARMPVLCPRSNGTVSTHILTVLTVSGVKHVLHSSRSPLAPQVLKWLLEQVDAICNDGSEEQKAAQLAASMTLPLLPADTHPPQQQQQQQQQSQQQPSLLQRPALPAPVLFDSVNGVYGIHTAKLESEPSS